MTQKPSIAPTSSRHPDRQIETFVHRHRLEPKLDDPQHKRVRIPMQKPL